MRRLFSIAVSVAAAICSPAHGTGIEASYPEKPIRIISPYPPGGATEIVGRIVGERIAKSLGQPVLIDSKPGASGMIGAELAAKAAPDGYTLLLGATPVFSTNPHMFRNMKYDAGRDFSPIAQVATVPLVLVVGPQVPAKNLEEFLAWTRARAEPLSYASPSIGSPPHLMMETLKKRFSLKLNHVPYKGSAQAMTDLMGGHVVAAFDNVVSTYQHIKSGRMRALAIGHSTRLASLPDVPTFSELGYPELQAATWLALVAPAGLPATIADKLNHAANEALAEPDVAARLLEQGAIPSPGTPAALEAFMRSESDRWAKIIEDSGVTLE